MGNITSILLLRLKSMLHFVGRHNFQWKLRSKQKYHVHESCMEKGVSTFFQGKPSDMKVHKFKRSLFAICATVLK